jgi:alpha-galactosidase
MRRLLALATAALTVLSTAVVLAVAAPAAPAFALDNGLARTPPMGFNDWNAFGCGVSEQLIKDTADLFVSSGLKAAGYRYVNIDDCWMTRSRDPQTGRLVPDPAKFPDGIAGTADYVHGKGLKLGIYEDAGTNTCAGYPGSLGHEDLDAQTLADWGVDYLKYDNCYNQSDGSQADYIRRYTAMGDALARTGRPIVFSVCEWGSSQPWTWAAGVGNLWRTTGDISDNWTSLRSIIGQNAPLYPHAGPGHWNDPDMLEIGNGGMTATEYRTHMSMWAMMAAPLIIGTDLRKASAQTLALLTNSDVVGIDQDRLGVQATVVSNSGGVMALDKPLADGQRAIALYNSTDALATVSVAARATGLRRAPAYRLRDVWTGAVTQAKSTIAAAVPAHGTVVYKVRPLVDPAGTAPSVTVAGSVATIVPGDDTLDTTVTNRGVGAIRDVRLSVTAPAGWTVTAATADRSPWLVTDASLRTRWALGVPPGVAAGQYTLTATASYTWGRAHRATTASDVVATVVTAPADGRRYLSTVVPAGTSNGLGPVEVDQSNGGAGPGDGNLITIGGKVYDRGLGTVTAGEIRYYLGGRCAQLTTDVGVDDEDTSGTPATFTVYADDAVAATGSSGTLTADLTGTRWLRLVTAGPGVHADWAAPVLTCGGAGPGDPIQPVDRTLFSFESGTDGFTIANAGGGGSVEPVTAFHTDGDHGLLVHTPVNGNWFGLNLATPLDLTGTSMLKFDMKAAGTGSVGEFAIQVGPDFSWCQGGQWTWTNPNSSRTVTRGFNQISCPAGVTLDRSQIRGVWVFLNGGGDVSIDNIRAE